MIFTLNIELGQHTLHIFNILNLSGILEMWMAGVWLEEGENTT